MARRRFILIAAVVAAVAIAAFMFTRGGEEGETVAVVRGQAVEAVYATGTVEPVNWAALSVEKAARLTEIVKHEGEAVAQGDVIARFEANIEQANLSEMQAQQEYSKREYERMKGLWARKAISRQQFEEAKRELDAVNARINAMQSAIGKLTFVSPVSGVVLRRDIELGEMAAAGHPVFWVGQPKPLRITADVDEEDIGRVALGQRALIKSDAYPEAKLEGTVGEITPKGDPVNKVFRVRVSLPDNTPLLVGMTTEVNIVTRVVDDALLIPASAERGGNVWKDAKHAVPVKLGIRSDAQVQVLEGVSEGEAILRTPPPEK